MLSALKRSRPQNAAADWSADWRTPQPVSGVPSVTVDSATQLLTVYGSASLITDEISTLPVEVDGRRPLWVDEPTSGVDRIAWLGQIVWSLLLSGEAFLAPVWARGEVLSVDPLDPSACDVRLDGGRRVPYVNGVRSPNVVHIPGRMRPGDLRGMSPVEWCRTSIGLGLAAANYGAEWFAGEGNMPGVIEVPGQAQPESMKSIAQQWRRKRRTGGRGLPGVLDGGATWKATGVTNEQAQFLATRKYTAAEIAGQMFLLDPSDLGIPVEGTSLTYANLAERDQRRLRVALLPWIRRIESAVSAHLLTGGATYHFDVDSRLRGNTRESYEVLAIGLAAGFLTIDEVRSILGMPARPDDAGEPSAREIAEMIQKIYLGVGVVLTADEAREILNSGGANLPAGFTEGGQS